MKKSVFGTAFLVLALTCGSATAAGPAAAPYNWTGFYIGLNMGGTVNNSDYTLRPTGGFAGDPNNRLRTDSGNPGGGAYSIGGQLGYNYQIGRFVLGLETDFNSDGTDTSQSVNRPLSSPLQGNIAHTVHQNVDFFGTVRGRIGFTPRDRLLIYGTGGLAYGDVSSSSNVSFTAAGDTYAGSSSGMQAGWTAGAGTEYAFTDKWSVKLEYLYIDLGSRSSTYNTQAPFAAYSYATDLDTTQHVIRIGFNYKF